MEELKKETNDILEDVVEVCEEPVMKSGNGMIGVAVGFGALVLAGVGTYVYKKHKSKQESNDSETAKKRRFTLFRHKPIIEEEVEEVDDYFEEEIE